MLRKIPFAAAWILALAMAPSDARPRDAVLAAARLLGADTITSLRFTASGATFSVGQNFTPSDPWPRVTVKNYIASINYETASMRQDFLREMDPVMPRGGGVPFVGERHQIQTVSGNYAWDEPIPPDPQAGSFPAGCCTPPEAGGTPPISAPAPGSQVACMLMLLATPEGFVKAALANNATSTKVSDGAAVSFVIAGKYKMSGLINGNDEVTRVQTWIEQSIIGDMLVETDYSGYKDFGGVRFPSRILQKTDGFPSLDLAVTSVQANPRADITCQTASVMRRPRSSKRGKKRSDARAGCSRVAGAECVVRHHTARDAREVARTSMGHPRHLGGRSCTRR